MAEDKKEKDLEEKVSKEQATSEANSDSSDPNYFRNLMARYDAVQNNRIPLEENASIASPPAVVGLNPPMNAINSLPPEALTEDDQRRFNRNVIPGFQPNFEKVSDQPITQEAIPEEGEEQTDQEDATTATKDNVAPIVKEQSASMPTAPVSNPTINTVENLKKAQDAANQIRNNAQFLKSLNIMGAGIAHAPKANTEVFDEQAKGADEIENNFKALGEQEANDPQSQQSQTFRDYAKRFGVALPPNVSANTGKTLLPYIFKGFEASEQRDARHEDIKYKYAELKAIQDQKGKEKKDKDYDSKLTKASQELDALQGGRGLLKAPTQKLQTAQSLEGLLSQYPDLNKMNPNQIAEFTSGFNNLITGGQATDVKLRKILPNDIGMSGANVLQWISNNPQGAQQKAFLDQMAQSVKTQKKVAEDQINQGLNKHLESIEKTLRPEDVESLRTIRGITKPSKNQSSSEGGTVSIRRKSDGSIAKVPSDQADKFLSQPDRFEKI